MSKSKAKELSTEEKLKNLFDLQHIHNQIDEINTLRGELPMEVKDLEDELEGLSKRIANLDEEVAELHGNITDNNLAKEEAQALIERYTQQQNQVKNNREYDALTKEVELQNLNIQLSEKKNKDANSAIESKMVYLDESKGLLENRSKDLELKREELDKIMAETAIKEEKLIKKATRKENAIEDRLLNAYNRIRKTYRNGLAVVSIEREACGGCFAKIPPQRQLEIRQRKRFILCEHCGRVIVDFED